MKTTSNNFISGQFSQVQRGLFAHIQALITNSIGYRYTFLIAILMFLISTSACGNPEYSFVTKWGSYGTGPGEFNQSHYIDVDSSGYIYVADWFNNRVQKFTSSGDYITQWGSSGTGNGQFNAPIGIACDNIGYVYVTDYYNDRVQKFTSDGIYVTQWGVGGSGAGQFNKPHDIEVDSSGDVYVCDHLNHRVQVFASDGTYLAQWGSPGNGNGQFNRPGGIEYDSSGLVYVSDVLNHRVQIFTTSGTYVGQFGQPGTGAGQFNQPHGITIDSSGYVYVTDRDNHRVQVFTSDGFYITEWGRYGSGDGQFGGPYGIASDSSGYIYVSELASRIQKFGQTLLVQVDIDIKPGSCPNPLNVKDKGVLPVAVLGTEDLDVFNIDSASIRLEGVAPIRSSYEDVAMPVSNKANDCDCTTEGSDGYLDLVLKFDAQEIVAALGSVYDGDIYMLTLTGEDIVGIPIEGTDCIIIVAKGSK